MFSWDQQARLEQTQAELRDTFARAVAAFGGVDALASALNERPSYGSKISEAINGRGDRKVQWDWFAPLFDDPRSAEIVATYVNARAGYQPPVLERDVDPADIQRALSEELDRLGDLKADLSRRVAKRLGVRADKVRL